MTFCTIELAGQPRGKANGWPVRLPQGGMRVIVNPQSRKYMNSVGWVAQVAMAGRAPTAMPVRITINAFIAIPQSWSKKKRADAVAGRLWPIVKPDWDNIGKQCDALKGVVWVDDKQVVIATVVKLYAERPRLVIEVDEIGTVADQPVDAIGLPKTYATVPIG